MIGKLKGRVEEIGEEHVLLDVNGVCYLAFLSGRSLSALPGVGEAATLFIETHVREDHIHLYGFTSAEERQWFKLLSTVQGVGAKMALAILSAFTPDELAQAIQAKDAKLLTRASGVGPKLGERIVTELKNKVTKIASSAVSMPAHGGAGKPALSIVPSSPQEEAVSALVNLGYGRSEAFSAVTLAQRKTGSEALDELIRHGLRELAS